MKQTNPEKISRAQGIMEELRKARGGYAPIDGAVLPVNGTVGGKAAGPGAADGGGRRRVRSDG